MPNTKLTDEQLQEWYARFAKELLEKVSIDVTRIEDVGRVKNYAIIEWGSLDDAQAYERAKVGHPTYAFMPHEGTRCKVERPEHVTFEEHRKWLFDNLRTELSIEDIRNLYNMSRAGTLMVNAPGLGPKFIQQVYTDENGNITTSEQIENLGRGSFQRSVNEGTNWVGTPAFVPVPDPAQYAPPPEPEAPEQPENMNPSWWSWLGWKLGIKDTDYGKLMEYNKAFERYQERLTQWQRIDPEELSRNYQAAVERRQQFENKMAEYRTGNMAILHGVNGGYITYATEQVYRDNDLGIDDSKSYSVVMNQEDQYMKAEHDKTPLGQLGNAMQKVKAHRDDAAKRTLKTVNCLMSIQHPENALEQWLIKGVFKSADFNFKDKKSGPHLPEPPIVREKGLSHLTDEELAGRKAWRDDVDALAGLAGFCALGETAKENFSDLVASFFTEGRANSSDKIPYIKPARLKGTQAVAAFVDGDATKVGELFTTGLRMLNREVQSITNLQDQHILGCMFLIDKLMKTAEEKTDIKENLGLTEQELEEVKVNRALFKAVYQGRDARTSLMEYAIHKKAMTQEELKQAALDILFEDYVTKMSIDGTKPDFTNPEIVEKVKRNLASRNDLDKFTAMKPEEVGHLAQSMVDFVKGLSAQKGLVVNVKQELGQQPVNAHEMQQKEVSMQ